ncbi:MAG: TFIIB-type zinc ribbon-containing protein [Candidatus Aenigmatarchaeota archaeon]
MKRQEVLLDQENCPECGNEKILTLYESKERVCPNCGFVFPARDSDTHPEWRAYNLEQKEERSRVGSPLTYTLHDRGLSTEISCYNIDAHGKKLTPEQKEKFYRLRKYQNKSKILNSAEEILRKGLIEIRRIVNNLELPKDFYETASYNFREIWKQKINRGRDTNKIAAATIYLTCRQLGIPRTLEEISKASHIKKKDIGRNYRHIVNSYLEKEGNYILPTHDLSKYTSKFLNKLNIYGKTEEVAHRICRAAKNVGMPGKNPSKLSTAIIYTASVLTGERKSQKEIAEKANCTLVTIRKRAKELIKRLTYDVYV